MVGPSSQDQPLWLVRETGLSRIHRTCRERETKVLFVIQLREEKCTRKEGSVDWCASETPPIQLEVERVSPCLSGGEREAELAVISGRGWLHHVGNNGLGGGVSDGDCQ